MWQTSDARRVALVINAASRRGAGVADELAGLVRRSGDLGQVDVRVHPISSGAEVGATLDRALAEGPDLLIVGGGDGTVSAAAGRVAHTGVVLGVLPLGTANDFARTLDLPTDPRQALYALLAGKVVDLDLGRVDETPYLNVASIGLSVGVTERLSDAWKRRLGPAAYPLAALRAYVRHEPFTAWLEFPDHDHPSLELPGLLQLAVGNGRHYGGGNAVSPTASLDDHLLDVYAIRHGRITDHVSMAHLFRSGRFVEHERVDHLTTRRVLVRTDREMAVNLDGELAARTPAEFSVERNAVHVVVPLHTDSVAWDGPGAALEATA